MTSSPCVKVCVIDDAEKLCRGCFRTIDEIVSWGSMTEQSRLEVMQDLPSRRVLHGSEQPA
ncbi:MAG: DUF1289 domain-containing protein [Pseudomonadota bacterium]